MRRQRSSSLTGSIGSSAGSSVTTSVGSDRGCERRSASRKSAHAVASQVLGKSAALTSTPVLKVTVTTAFDAQVVVSLEGAKAEGRGLPAVCRAGSSSTVTLSAPRNLTGKPCGMKGKVEIGGFSAPTRFFLNKSGESTSWVESKGHWKHTAVHTASWDWKNAGAKPTEGSAADIELQDNGELKISLRPMTAVELQRTLQLQALREASLGEDYDTLRAQVTKARMASVNTEDIALGEARLKELKEKGLHVSEGCDRASVREKMDWSLVSSKVDAERQTWDEPCTACEDCECNVVVNPFCNRHGEDFKIQEGHVQEILKAFGEDADRILFEELIDAALAAEEGCIWKAGGKFIFSEFNRNQSILALERMLIKYNKHRCAKMMVELHKHTERKYNSYVAAVQINVHTSGASFHDQHRDIYSVKQSAGPNCTCQFTDCSGTVCYSLGSSRLAMMSSMTDNLSNITACGEDCKGRREFVWLHSGSSMYFNTDWNNSHTHGIPPVDEETGPRISIALLMSPKPTNCMFVVK